MLEHLVSASDLKSIEKKYNVRSFYNFNEIPVPSVIGAGDVAYTIAYENYQYLNPMTFGQSGKSIEGKPVVTTSIFIDSPTPAFSYYHHMSQHYPRRCLVIVDAFIVSSADDKKYLIHLQSGERAFSLAGFYETRKDAAGKPQVSFALGTVNASDLLQKVGVSQMPIIVDQRDVPMWIMNDYVGSDIRKILKTTHVLNGYPVNELPTGPVTWDQLRPVGDRLNPFNLKRATMHPVR